MKRSNSDAEIGRMSNIDQNKRPIKVLHLIESLNIGGAERLLVTLAKYIDKIRFNVIIGCIDDDGPLLDDIKEAGVRYICFKQRRFRYGYRKYIGLYKYIRGEKIDIVHTHLHRANYIGRLMAYLAGCPLIIKHEHGYAGDYAQQNVLPRPSYYWINKLLNKITDAYIYVSQAQKDDAGRKEGGQFVVYNSLDENGSVSTKSRDSIRSELGLSAKDIVVGTIGQLAPHKGHQYLFDAITDIKKIHPGVKILIVGSGLEKSILKTLAVKLNIETDVTFLGSRKNIWDLLKAMDIFVQPSLFESFGIAIIEAMYSMLPIIATNVGGIIEIIKDGETGYLVAPKDPRALKEAIERIINDFTSAREMGERGRNVVLSKFTGEKYAMRLAEIYEKLINNMNS